MRCQRHRKALANADKQHYPSTPELIAGELCDFAPALAETLGWEYGASTAAHLIGYRPIYQSQNPNREGHSHK